MLSPSDAQMGMDHDHSVRYSFYPSVACLPRTDPNNEIPLDKSSVKISRYNVSLLFLSIRSFSCSISRNFAALSMKIAQGGSMNGKGESVHADPTSERGCSWRNCEPLKEVVQARTRNNVSLKGRRMGRARRWGAAFPGNAVCLQWARLCDRLPFLLFHLSSFLSIPGIPKGCCLFFTSRIPVHARERSFHVLILPEIHRRAVT